MNVHGFWSNVNARKHGPSVLAGTKDTREPMLTTQPQPPPGRHSPSDFEEGGWRSHADRDAVARAEISKCQLPEVGHRDS